MSTQIWHPELDGHSGRNRRRGHDAKVKLENRSLIKCLRAESLKVAGTNLKRDPNINHNKQHANSRKF